MADKLLLMYRYAVEAYNGDTRVFLETDAAYVKNEEGFMAFKNTSHETVLMVNTNHVITVERGDRVSLSDRIMVDE